MAILQPTKNQMPAYPGISAVKYPDCCSADRTVVVQRIERFDIAR